MYTKFLTLGIMLLLTIPFGTDMIFNVSASSHNNALNSQQQCSLNFDSKEDLVVAGYDDMTVLYGNGDGGFSKRNDYPKGEGQADVIAHDFNSDGYIDVAVTSYWDTEVTVYLNDGFGGFSNSTNYSVGKTSGLNGGDFNEDGFFDLIICNYDDINGLTILYGDGSGGFGGKLDFFFNGLTDIIVSDFNKDNHSDVAVTQFDGQKVFVLPGDGSGTFPSYNRYIVGVNPYQITCGDVNNDGAIDLIVTNYDQYDVGSIKILYNDGSGGFTNQIEYPAGYGPVGILSDYFNNDDFLDLAVTNFIDGSLMVYINNGSGGFETPEEIAIGIMPYYLTSVDLNRDSVKDLAVALSGENSICILLGTGTGTFLCISYESVGRTPYAVVAANVDPIPNTPDLTIKIEDKKIIISNIGDADAEQVTGQVTVTGGNFGLINKQESFSLEVLIVNEELIVSIPLVFGLGTIKIDIWVDAVNCDSVQKSVEGYIIFFWIFL